MDPQQSNKKCPSSGRLFHFEGNNAVLEKCKEACIKNDRCYYFSWKVGQAWCTGCEGELTEDAEGAIAFKKKIQDENGNTSVQLGLKIIEN